MVCRPLYCQCGCCSVKQRISLAIMLHFALVNAYQVRVAMGIALTELLQHGNTTKTHNACPELKYEKVEVKDHVYDWPNWVEAMILYAFYIGYIFGNLPGGWLADKFGGRHVMGTSMVLSAFLTWALPASIEYGGYHGAIIQRLFLGLVQGPLFPSVSAFMQNWVPQPERGVFGGIAYSGSNLGTLLGGIITGYVIRTTETWHAPFYLWGVVILVWYVFYLLMVFSKPSTHPYIAERTERHKSFEVPWGSLITSLPAWALFWAQFGHNFIFFTIFSTLPKFMKEILKLGVTMNATFSTLPFFCLWLSGLIFAFLSHIILDRSWMTLLGLRKWFTAFANTVPCIFILLTVYVGCNRPVSITFFNVGVALLGPFFSGMKVNVNDLTRHYSGTIMAWVSGVGSLGGVVGIWLVGSIAVTESIEEWRIVYWIMLGVGLGTSIFYFTFAKAERQSWDFPDD